MLIFDFISKKNLANRISRIKQKEVLVKIMKLIKKENPYYTENDNGIYVCFQNLSNQTYNDINDIVTEFEKNEQTKQQYLQSMSFSFVPLSVSEMDVDSQLEKNYKLNNKQKSIIKKQMSEDFI
jgi:hypothetical protein